MQIVIRKAEPSEAEALTSLTFKSKGYWEYPDDYMRIWEDELTVSDEYINRNIVYVAEADGRLAGYYSIIKRDTDQWSGETFIQKGYWLDNMFILPEYIRMGIGSELIRHAKRICSYIGSTKLFVFSDPHSQGFYMRHGFNFVMDCPSSIPGRTIPMLELDPESGTPA